MHPVQCFVIVERDDREPDQRHGERHPVGLRHVEVTADEGPAMHPHESRADVVRTPVDPSCDVAMLPVNHDVPDVDIG